MGREQADCRRSGERRRPRGGASPPTDHPAAEAHAAPRERARARGSPLSTRRRDPGHVHRVPLHHGRLAVAVEHERRERGRVRRGQELRQGVERLDLPDGVREHVLLHLLGDALQADARDVARGATGGKRFGSVPWPPLKPVTIVVVVFSVIQTFCDFQLIYVLTGGGPANSTHLLATYAYQVGVATGLLGEGAAISLFMLPVLFVVVWLQLRYLRRMEGA